MSNNILFFLTPKAMCVYLYDDYTMRQALEKMEAAGYSALPILNRRGEYRGTLTEGDLLWGIKNMCYMDIRQADMATNLSYSSVHASLQGDLPLLASRGEVSPTCKPG